LNIIEYLFCERLFGKVLLIEKICSRKSVAGKVRQENYGRKSATEKSQQKKCGRKSAIEKSRQQHGWGLFMRDMAHIV
jgi:hypothetical protein